MGSVGRLDSGGWLLVARMTFWRIALPLLRRMFATERLVGLLASPRFSPRDPDRETLALAVTGRLWRRSSGTCLERSLAAHRELGRSGALPRLVLGAAPGTAGIVGHAWVEVDGRAVLETTDPRAEYTPLVEFDASGARLPRPE